MTTDISLVRWDPSQQQEIVDDFEYDGGNSSSRLFERSRIKALAGKTQIAMRWCACFFGRAHPDVGWHF
jgi:spectrin beta